MNLREGTRRLALLLGVVGAIAGGIFAYAQLQSTMRQRADHQRFEQLANSPAVQQERKLMLSESEGRILFKAPDGTQRWVSHGERDAAVQAGGVVIDDGETAALDENGIKTIRWDAGYEVGWIETQDGQTVYSMPAPSAGPYLLIAILPLLGFFVPWGAVRAIGWVGAGFVAAPSLSRVASATVNDSSAKTTKEERTLVSRKAWIVISIISLLIAFSNASKSGAVGAGEFLPLVIGGLIGGLVLFGGGWALVVLVHRWILRRRSTRSFS